MTTTDTDRCMVKLAELHQRYAVKFALDCEMRLGDANAEPTDENLAVVLRGCARRPQPEEFAAIREDVLEYRAFQVRYRAAVAELAGTLSDFRQYPPEECITDGKCYACDHQVTAHHGMFATGSDKGGIFGVYLHTGCLADVRRARTSLEAESAASCE